MFRLYGIVFMLLALICGGCSGPDEDPNVVVFLIDTLRADRLGAYGYERDTSPHIDALAAESVLFTQAHSPAPWTLPSIVSIHTSSFLTEHGLVREKQSYAPHLRPWATHMQNLGYATGSFYTNVFAGSVSGLDWGFDTCVHVKEKNAEGIKTTDGARVATWLEQLEMGPFFLYVHNVEPHNPFRVPRRLADLFGAEAFRFRKDYRELSAGYRKATRTGMADGKRKEGIDTSPEQTRMLEELFAMKAPVSDLYDAAVRLSDEQLGSVVDTLKALGAWDNTLFILISDHGEEFGEHGGWQHDQSVYEELVHVPFLVRFPGGHHAGLRVQEQVSLVDLMPTVLDYLGSDTDRTGMRGRSLMPLIRGERTETTAAPQVTSARVNAKKYYRPFKESRGDTNIVMRLGKWKGIYNAELDTVELYDLDADPAENHDQSADHADLVADWRRWGRSWLDVSLRAGTGNSISVELDEETMSALRSLGYVN